MTPERWRAVKGVIEDIAAAPPGARERILAESCAGDEELRAEVESLLLYETRAGRLDGVGQSPGIQNRTIGPYRVERLLGSGGMGSVWLALRDDDRYSKRVAIKTLSGIPGPEEMRRFRTEVRVLAGLEHPNIARLIDAGELPGGQPYLVMEYVDGIRIDDFSSRQGLTITAILTIFLKVCAAVQFAHQRFVVHRDLKAGNILVSDDAEPHLLDFGIARLEDPLAPAMASTQPAQRMLTPASASPEQIMGGPVTAASDVYSLGILLYALVSGSQAYAGAKDFLNDPARVICGYAPPPPSQTPGLAARARATLAGDLDNVVGKAIEKDPARRYQTVDELAADLRRFLENRPVQARPASVAYRLRKFVARNRAMVTVVSLLSFAILAGLAGTLWYARQSRAAEARAQSRFESLRKLTNTMLFEVDGTLTNLPGAMAARQAVVARALEYLDQMASDSSRNPAVLEQLGVAYLRIGAIQANQETAHTGGAGSLSAASASVNRALGILKPLADAAPRDLRLQRDLWQALWQEAEILRYTGDLEGAKAIHTSLREKSRRMIADDPAHDADGVSRRGLGASLNAIAQMEIEEGHTSAGIALMREALAVRSDWFSATKSTAARRGLAIGREYMGRAYAAAGDYRAAEENQSAGLALIGPLFAASPADVDLQSIVMSGNAYECEYLSRLSKRRDAAPHCRRALTLAEAKAKANAGDAQAATDLASVNATLAVASDLSGDTAEALRRARESRRLYLESLRRDPDYIELTAEASRNDLRLAAILRRKGLVAEARGILADAAGRLRAASARSPLHAGIAASLREAEAGLTSTAGQ